MKVEHIFSKKNSLLLFSLNFLRENNAFKKKFCQARILFEETHLFSEKDNLILNFSHF